jgi:hypothetical protein
MEFTLIDGIMILIVFLTAGLISGKSSYDKDHHSN